MIQWNVADYFNQNKDKLCHNSSIDTNKQKNEAQSTTREIMTDNNTHQKTVLEGTKIINSQELVYPDFPGITLLAEMSEFDKLWMCLFTKLGMYL